MAGGYRRKECRDEIYCEDRLSSLIGCAVVLMGGLKGVGVLLMGSSREDQPPSAGKVTPSAGAECPAEGTLETGTARTDTEAESH